MNPRPLLVGVVVLALVAASVGPATAGNAAGTESDASHRVEGSETLTATNLSSVGAGDRLQGVVGVQEAEVEGELATREFGIAVEAADSNASKAAVVADRVSDLETRLAALRDRKERLQRARTNGSITEGEYGAEMAAVAARTAAVGRLSNHSEAAARRLPRAALSDAGVDVDVIRALRQNASELAGPEVAAIARSIAGRNAGREMAASNRPEAAGGPTERPGRRPDSPGRSGTAASPGAGGAALLAPAQSVYQTLAGAASGLATAAGSVVGTASAQDVPEPADRPLLSVPVERDGSSRVSLVLTFDLSGDTASRAFETLRDDDRARADVKSRFRNRMRSVANQSESVTDREMRVTDPELSLSETANGTGVVVVSVEWDGIAAVEDDHLVVTEPFASGFTPDREFRVRITAPDTYRVTTVRPDPSQRSQASVTWPAGADLGGFTLVFSPEQKSALPEDEVERLQPDGTITQSDQSSPGVPGPGPLGTTLAVLVAGLLATRGRRDA
jgi:hypothetical protein